MSKRLLVAVATLLVFAAGCGKENGKAALTSENGATAAPTTTTGPESTAAASASGAPAASGKPVASSAAAAPAAKPPPKAAAGKLNAPKDGKYVYEYKGESSDPFNPAGPPSKFNGELTRTVSHKGNVYTEEQTTTESPGRTTIRTRREPTRVLLLYFKAETPAGDFACTLNPPLVIVKFPVKAEKFPTQKIQGQGNACGGKLDISVIGKENAKDAHGKVWSTWRAHVRLETVSDQFRNVSDQNQWVSPDLGADIRSDGTSSGEVKTAGGAQKFSGKATTALKSHP